MKFSKKYIEKVHIENDSFIKGVHMIELPTASMVSVPSKFAIVSVICISIVPFIVDCVGDLFI